MSKITVTNTKNQCLNCGANLRGHRHDYCIKCGCHDSALDLSAGPFARCIGKAAYKLDALPMQGKHQPQVCEVHLPLNGNADRGPQRIA